MGEKQAENAEIQQRMSDEFDQIYKFFSTTETAKLHQMGTIDFCCTRSEITDSIVHNFVIN